MILQDWVRKLKTNHGNLMRMIKAKGIPAAIEYYKNRENEPAA